MWCVKCNNHLSECTCEDLEERLRSVAQGGNFAYHECQNCGKHYSKCKCENPNLKLVIKIDDNNN